MTESIDSSHSCVSIGSTSSNGDCSVTSTYPRVLINYNAIFGIWLFTVKQGISLRFNDMPTRLPLGSLLIPVRQGRARPTPQALTRHSSAIVLLPVLPSIEDWRALP